MSEDLPYYTMDEMCALFDYSNSSSLQRALRSGSLPLEWYKVKGRVVVDKEAVRIFFALERARALQKVNEALEEEEWLT